MTFHARDNRLYQEIDHPRATRQAIQTYPVLAGNRFLSDTVAGEGDAELVPLRRANVLAQDPFLIDLPVRAGRWRSSLDPVENIQASIQDRSPLRIRPALQNVHRSPRSIRQRDEAVDVLGNHDRIAGDIGDDPLADDQRPASKCGTRHRTRRNSQRLAVGDHAVQAARDRRASNDGWHELRIGGRLRPFDRLDLQLRGIRRRGRAGKVVPPTVAHAETQADCQPSRSVEIVRWDLHRQNVVGVVPDEILRPMDPVVDEFVNTLALG